MPVQGPAAPPRDPNHDANAIATASEMAAPTVAHGPEPQVPPPTSPGPLCKAGKPCLRPPSGVPEDTLVPARIPRLRSVVESHAFRNILVDEMDMMVSRAATLIQSSWRRHRLRQKLVSQISTARAIQEAWRRFSTRRLHRSGQALTPQRRASTDEENIPYHPPAQVRFQNPEDATQPKAQAKVCKETQFPSADILPAGTPAPKLSAPVPAGQPGSITLLPHQTVTIKLLGPSPEVNVPPGQQPRTVQTSSLKPSESPVKAQDVTPVRAPKTAAPGAPVASQRAALKTQPHPSDRVIQKDAPQAPEAAKTLPTGATATKVVPPPLSPSSPIAAAGRNLGQPRVAAGPVRPSPPPYSAVSAGFPKTTSQVAALAPSPTATAKPPPPRMSSNSVTLPGRAPGPTTAQQIPRTPLHSCLAALMNRSPPHVCTPDPGAAVAKTPQHTRPPGSYATPAQGQMRTTKGPPITAPVPASLRTPPGPAPVTAKTPTAPTNVVPGLGKPRSHPASSGSGTKASLHSCRTITITKAASPAPPASAPLVKTSPKTRLAAMVTKTPGQLRCVTAVLRTLCGPQAPTKALTPAPPSTAATSSSPVSVTITRTKTTEVNARHTAGLLRATSQPCLVHDKATGKPAPRGPVPNEKTHVLPPKQGKVDRTVPGHSAPQAVPWATRKAQPPIFLQRMHMAPALQLRTAVHPLAQLSRILSQRPSSKTLAEALAQSHLDECLAQNKPAPQQQQQQQPAPPLPAGIPTMPTQAHRPVDSTRGLNTVPQAATATDPKAPQPPPLLGGLKAAGHPASNVDSWGDGQGAGKPLPSPRMPATTPSQDEMGTSQVASLCAELATLLSSENGPSDLSQALSKEALSPGMLGVALLKALNWGETGTAVPQALLQAEVRSEMNSTVQAQLADALSKALTEEERAALSQALCQGELGAVLSQELLKTTSPALTQAGLKAASGGTARRAPVEADLRGNVPGKWEPALDPERPQQRKVRGAWRGCVPAWPAEMGDGLMVVGVPCWLTVSARPPPRWQLCSSPGPVLAAYVCSLLSFQSWEAEATGEPPLPPGLTPERPSRPSFPLPAALWQPLSANGVGPSTGQPSLPPTPSQATHRTQGVAPRTWESSGGARRPAGKASSASRGSGRDPQSQHCTAAPLGHRACKCPAPGACRCSGPRRTSLQQKPSDPRTKLGGVGGREVSGEAPRCNTRMPLPQARPKTGDRCLSLMPRPLTPCSRSPLTLRAASRQPAATPTGQATPSSRRATPTRRAAPARTATPTKSAGPAPVATPTNVAPPASPAVVILPIDKTTPSVLVTLTDRATPTPADKATPTAVITPSSTTTPTPARLATPTDTPMPVPARLTTPTRMATPTPAGLVAPMIRATPTRLTTPTSTTTPTTARMVTPTTVAPPTPARLATPTHPLRCLATPTDRTMPADTATPAQVFPIPTCTLGVLEPLRPPQHGVEVPGPPECQDDQVLDELAASPNPSSEDLLTDPLSASTTQSSVPRSVTSISASSTSVDSLMVTDVADDEAELVPEEMGAASQGGTEEELGEEGCSSSSSQSGEVPPFRTVSELIPALAHSAESSSVTFRLHWSPHGRRCLRQAANVKLLSWDQAPRKLVPKRSYSLGSLLEPSAALPRGALAHRPCPKDLGSLTQEPVPLEKPLQSTRESEPLVATTVEAPNPCQPAQAGGESPRQNRVSWAPNLCLPLPERQLQTLSPSAQGASGPEHPPVTCRVLPSPAHTSEEGTPKQSCHLRAREETPIQGQTRATPDPVPAPKIMAVHPSLARPYTTLAPTPAPARHPVAPTRLRASGQVPAVSGGGHPQEAQTQGSSFVAESHSSGPCPRDPRSRVLRLKANSRVLGLLQSRKSGHQFHRRPWGSLGTSVSAPPLGTTLASQGTYPGSDMGGSPELCVHSPAGASLTQGSTRAGQSLPEAWESRAPLEVPSPVATSSQALAAGSLQDRQTLPGTYNCSWGSLSHQLIVGTSTSPQAYPGAPSLPPPSPEPLCPPPTTPPTVHPSWPPPTSAPETGSGGLPWGSVAGIRRQQSASVHLASRPHPPSGPPTRSLLIGLSPRPFQGPADPHLATPASHGAEWLGSPTLAKSEGHQAGRRPPDTSPRPQQAPVLGTTLSAYPSHLSANMEHRAPCLVQDPATQVTPEGQRARSEELTLKSKGVHLAPSPPGPPHVSTSPLKTGSVAPSPKPRRTPLWAGSSPPAVPAERVPTSSPKIPQKHIAQQLTHTVPKAPWDTSSPRGPSLNQQGPRSSLGPQTPLLHQQVTVDPIGPRSPIFHLQMSVTPQSLTVKEMAPIGAQILADPQPTFGIPQNHSVHPISGIPPNHSVHHQESGTPQNHSAYQPMSMAPQNHSVHHPSSRTPQNHSVHHPAFGTPQNIAHQPISLGPPNHSALYPASGIRPKQSVHRSAPRTPQNHSVHSASGTPPKVSAHQPMSIGPQNHSAHHPASRIPQNLSAHQPMFVGPQNHSAHHPASRIPQNLSAHPSMSVGPKNHVVHHPASGTPQMHTVHHPATGIPPNHPVHHSAPRPSQNHSVHSASGTPQNLSTHHPASGKLPNHSVHHPAPGPLQNFSTHQPMSVGPQNHSVQHPAFGTPQNLSAHQPGSESPQSHSANQLLFRAPQNPTVKEVTHTVSMEAEVLTALCQASLKPQDHSAHQPAPPNPSVQQPVLGTPQNHLTHRPMFRAPQNQSAHQPAPGALQNHSAHQPAFRTPQNHSVHQLASMGPPNHSAYQPVCRAPQNHSAHVLSSVGPQNNSAHQPVYGTPQNHSAHQLASMGAPNHSVHQPASEAPQNHSAHQPVFGALQNYSDYQLGPMVPASMGPPKHSVHQPVSEAPQHHSAHQPLFGALQNYSDHQLGPMVPASMGPPKHSVHQPASGIPPKHTALQPVFGAVQNYSDHQLGPVVPASMGPQNHSVHQPASGVPPNHSTRHPVFGALQVHTSLQWASVTGITPCSHPHGIVGSPGTWGSHGLTQGSCVRASNSAAGSGAGKAPPSLPRRKSPLLRSSRSVASGVRALLRGRSGKARSSVRARSHSGTPSGARGGCVGCAGCVPAPGPAPWLTFPILQGADDDGATRQPRSAWEPGRGAGPWAPAGEQVASVQVVEKLRVRAVVTLQAGTRGYLVRRSNRARQQCASVIQAAWRGYCVRRDLARLARAALVIQAAWRGFSARHCHGGDALARAPLPARLPQESGLSPRISDHRCFQSCQPQTCHLCQSLSPGLGSAPSVVMLVGSSPRTCHMCGQTVPTRVVHGLGQRSGGHSAPRPAPSPEVAATLIQAAWKGFHVRREHQQQQEAARRLQASWRGHATRASFSTNGLLGLDSWSSPAPEQWRSV